MKNFKMALFSMLLFVAGVALGHGCSSCSSCSEKPKSTCGPQGCSIPSAPAKPTAKKVESVSSEVEQAPVAESETRAHEDALEDGIPAATEDIE